MNLSLDANTRTQAAGNLAGWAVAFLTRQQAGMPVPADAALLLSHADYFARIEASLPGDLSGGRFAVTIEAMTDAHYAIARDAVAAELYLFWQDVNADIGSFLLGLTGIMPGATRAQLAPALVARFAIRKRARTRGLRGGDASFEGRDWAYDRLATTQPAQLCFDQLSGLVNALASAAQITITPEPSLSQLMPAGTPPEAERTGADGQARSTLAEVEALRERIAAGLREDAPSVALLRRGALHLGRRTMPYPEAAVPTLDISNGLAAATAEGDANAAAGPRHWRLMLRGRPDIFPGHVVAFRAPPEDAPVATPDIGMALVGAFAGLAGGFGGPEPPDTRIHVSGVVHRMSRQAGLQTEVTGVELPLVTPPDPWSLFLRAENAAPARRTPGADTATAVARQVRNISAAVMRRMRLPEIAEVREANAAPPALPHMTLTTWEGTAGNPAENQALRRHPIARARAAEQRGVAVLTPFAWGACGLAMPRYPGMRVMLGYRNGSATECFEIGATWGPGARMQPQPGDWWLCLPRGASTAALAPGDRADHTPGPDQAAVHDLTDAAGARVIQVDKLTLRIGADSNAKAGTRPAHGNKAFTLSHADGKAEITMDQNGVITLKGERINIDAGSNGTVAITAKDVNINVQNRVNVT